MRRVPVCTGYTSTLSGRAQAREEDAASACGYTGELCGRAQVREEDAASAYGYTGTP